MNLLQNKLILIVSIVLIVFCVILLIIYFTCIPPKTICVEINVTDVERVLISSGLDGKQYVFTENKADELVKAFSGTTLHRDKSSTNYDGFAYSVAFYDNHDKCIFSCIINSNTSLVVSDYFYICDNFSGHGIIKKMIENET